MRFIQEFGYTVKVGQEEADKIVGVAGRLPSAIQVDVDANQALGNPKIAIGVFERVRREAFHPNLSIEQPLHHLDPFRRR